MFSPLPSMAGETPPGFADLVEKLTPTVVNISTTQKMPGDTMNATATAIPEGFHDFPEHPENKDDSHKIYSLGSGFIIDPNGYIATNNHVISGSGDITITLSDDTKLDAQIVGHDEKTDLALLKVEAGKKLPSVVFGNSDKARVGDWVIAIGNPFGFGGTVTAGIISARARNLNAGPFDDFIQTDAAINRGNSGGPMFNLQGQVIGINTAIYSPSGENVGIGFAMPIALAKTVFEQLKTKGYVERSWIGIRIEDVTAAAAHNAGLKKPYGALVMSVAENGPAAKAGIVAGDVIVRFDGKNIREMRMLPLCVAETEPGSAVPVELWRKGELHKLVMHVGKLKG